jgi:hypothetical protein
MEGSCWRSKIRDKKSISLRRPCQFTRFKRKSSKMFVRVISEIGIVSVDARNVPRNNTLIIRFRPAVLQPESNSGRAISGPIDPSAVPRLPIPLGASFGHRLAISASSSASDFSGFSSAIVRQIVDCRPPRAKRFSYRMLGRENAVGERRARGGVEPRGGVEKRESMDRAPAS